MLDLAPDEIVVKDRLRPGASSSSTPREGASSPTRRSSASSPRRIPMRDWLRENLVDIDDLPEPPYMPRVRHETVVQPPAHVRLHRRRSAACCSRRWRPTGEEPIGSMGTDTRAGRALGPAARALRLLQADVRPGHQSAARRDPRAAGDDDGIDGGARRQPARADGRSRAARSSIDVSGHRQHAAGAPAPRVPAGVPLDDDSDAVRSVAERRRASSARSRTLKQRASGRRRRRLHDRHPVGPRRRPAHRAPIPSLLATAAVHHHLVRKGTRTRCGLVVESGDAREVHHCALLLGYGAGVVNPYLAFETIADLIRRRGTCRASTLRDGGRALHPRAEQGHPRR